jgi:hypothetical protein
MSGANLDLVISLALMLIAIVSVWRDVYKNDPTKKWFNRVTRVGWILVTTSLVFILISYLKDKRAEQNVIIAELAKNKADSISDASQKKLAQSQEKLKESEDSLYNLQIASRETILQRVDSSYRKSIRASNEALAKYHIKIVDSLHTVVGTLNFNSVHPQLALAPISIHPPVFLDRLGSDTLKLQFVAANSTCFNIRMDAYFFSISDSGARFLYKDSLFIGGAFINPNVVSTVTFPVRNDILALSRSLVVLYGSFTKDALEKMPIPYFEAFEFDFQKNKYLEKPQLIASEFKGWMGIK